MAELYEVKEQEERVILVAVSTDDNDDTVNSVQELAELEDPELFEKRLSDLICDPEIDTDLFATAVQKVLISGYLSGLSERKTNRIPDNE